MTHQPEWDEAAAALQGLAEALIGIGDWYQVTASSDGKLLSVTDHNAGRSAYVTLIKPDRNLDSAMFAWAFDGSAPAAHADAAAAALAAWLAEDDADSPAAPQGTGPASCPSHPTHRNEAGPDGGGHGD